MGRTLTPLGMIVPLVAIATCCIHMTLSTGDIPDHPFCLDGASRDAFPTKQDNLEDCQYFDQLSCCNHNFTKSLRHAEKGGAWMDIKWNLCGPMSQECEIFFKMQECFIQCEPTLGKYRDIDNHHFSGVYKVPICGPWCDAWYESCAADLTCVSNWHDGNFDYMKETNVCPLLTSCQTFRTVYSNGENMCNAMFGDSYYYESDTTKCLVMGFDPNKEDPNFKVFAKAPTHSDMYKLIFSVLSMLIVLTL